MLVERGALIDVVARNEQLRVTPLQSAAAAREEETAALLLERGADPNVQQRGGFTALHAAAQNGDDPLVALLLARGADPALAAEDGRTAADMAGDAGHAELAARRERLSGSHPRLLHGAWGHPGPPPAFDANAENARTCATRCDKSVARLADSLTAAGAVRKE